MSLRYVVSETVPRLLLQTFMQDHVENEFSIVRRKGGFNDHPEYREAISAFSSLDVNLLLGVTVYNKKV